MNHRFGEEVYRNTAAAAQRVEEGAAEATAEVQREAKQWLTQLEQQIVRNPLLALGIALAAGVTLGMLCKRS